MQYSGFFASKSKKAAAEAELQRAESALLLLVPGSILGTHLRTLVIKNSHSNTGLAISSDGSVMAVTNVSTHKVLVYSLLHGALRGEFGGKGSGMGQFNNPEKICFASRSSTNVFIADSDNKRVQVCPCFGVIAMVSRSSPAAALSHTVLYAGNVYQRGTCSNDR